jgi:DNA polymerase I-like protein with 3'-5' exonuclease and polymerase domains
MKYVVLDIETKDPYIDRGLGSGWVYKHHTLPNCDYKLLGTAYKSYDGSSGYITNLNELQVIADAHDSIICHNASYDIGGLSAYGVLRLEDKDLYDTEIMSRLYNSSLLSHSLDILARKYLKMTKDNKGLCDKVHELDLYPYLKKELTAKARAEKLGEEWVRDRPDEKKLEKWCKSNMDIIQASSRETVAKYAIQDVECTEKLFLYFKDKVDMNIALKYSMVTHICLDYRRRGIRVDLKRAREIRDEMIPLIKKYHDECYRIAGCEFGINSIKDMPVVFDKLGIEYPRTEAGNPSITTPWMQNQTHPLCKAIVEARKALKIDRDFVNKVLEIQEYTSPDMGQGDYGRVFPELHIMRARTGRFSCTGYNMQQIPSRDPVFGPMCRSMFIPEEGETWYAIDFSNQEGRLQVHYANRLKCEGASLIAAEFNKDANLDMHQMVADMVGIGRREAKAINLGVSYGMGVSKLADQLGVDVKKAKIILDKYNTLAPYLHELNQKCMKVMQNRKAIKTIGGRYSAIDPTMVIDGRKVSFEYKALNKLIQGSAVDQTIEAMIKAYEEGIPVLLPVHDELCMSGTKEQAVHLKEIMETAFILDVPVVADLGEGKNWSEAH